MKWNSKGMRLLIGLGGAATAICLGVAALPYPSDQDASGKVASAVTTPQGPPPPAVQPPAPPEPVVVPMFRPRHVAVCRVNEQGSQVESFVSLDMDPVVLRLVVDSPGVNNVRNNDGEGSIGPGNSPGLLEWQTGESSWARSWPGTDGGTAQIIGHTKADAPNWQFTPLEQRLNIGPADYAGGLYRVTLRGPTSQSLTYVIRDVVLVPKANDGSFRPELKLEDNAPGRLFVTTCEKEGGQGRTFDRYLIAELDPLLASSASCA